MSLRFAILGSGSSGNCALLETARCRILIDAGFSARKIGELLEARGLHPDELDAVFITHEHGDHAAGVNGLSRRPALKVFANPGTIEAITPRLRRRPTWQAFTTGARFHFADLEVESFPIPHDAGDPVGFIFRHGEGDLFSPRQSLAWVTDLGHAPALVAERIRDVDTL
ncbi:MAG: MBL fold metallo-hydrolase, partial [Puniceicoccaceae bacterium]